MARRHASDIGVIGLDVLMSKLDGFEVLKSLQRDPRTAYIPVIMLTAHANHEGDLIRSIGTGAAAHIAKPFRGPVLMARIHALVNQCISARVLNARLEAAQRSAATDPLTGLRNRRQFEAALEWELVEAQRAGAFLSLASIDLDHFKRINDEYGHEAGDRALVHMARAIVGGLRVADQAFRVGGEELAILMRETDELGAVRVTMRLRQFLRVSLVDLPQTRYEIRFSAGVAAASPQLGYNRAELVRRADEALYRAKSEGRDRTVSSQDEVMAGAAVLC